MHPVQAVPPGWCRAVLHSAGSMHALDTPGRCRHVWNRLPALAATHSALANSRRPYAPRLRGGPRPPRLPRTRAARLGHGRLGGVRVGAAAHAVAGHGQRLVEARLARGRGAGRAERGLQRVRGARQQWRGLRDAALAWRGRRAVRWPAGAGGCMSMGEPDKCAPCLPMRKPRHAHSELAARAATQFTATARVLGATRRTTISPHVCMPEACRHTATRWLSPGALVTGRQPCAPAPTHEDRAEAQPGGDRGAAPRGVAAVRAGPGLLQQREAAPRGGLRLRQAAPQVQHLRARQTRLGRMASTRAGLRLATHRRLREVDTGISCILHLYCAERPN